MADRMDHTVYDVDILEWSEHQAALLRRTAAGERVNDLDWPNIIEEIESVGLSELRRVESLLFQALLHHLKILAWPQSRDIEHWNNEAIEFRAQASLAFLPVMYRRIDVNRLYAKALRVLRASMIDGQPPLPVPEVCNTTLDELLSDPSNEESGVR